MSDVERNGRMAQLAEVLYERKWSGASLAPKFEDAAPSIQSEWLAVADAGLDLLDEWGKEPLAALTEICRLEPDEKPDGTVLGYLVHGADEMAALASEAVRDKR